jgi:BirA family transcriptional regulator, biotin operon repressor / biotin---[acetyl-CoA-carboxylase] ligase
MSSGAPVHRFEQVSSTMDVLHELAAAGGETGTAVVASEQTGGRGSRGRTWHSPPGGLWLSILLRPDGESAVELLALRAGLAIARVLDELGRSRPVRIKWPNDLMIGEHKVGGILCEARWQGNALAWVVVGLGLNVQNPVPAELGAMATSLGGQVQGITPESLVEPVVSRLRSLSSATGLLSPDELAELGERDWLRGRLLRHPIPGHAAGISAEGALLVLRSDGSTVPLRSGTIELADALSQT